MLNTPKSPANQVQNPKSIAGSFLPDDLHKLVSDTAYYLAEQRNFEGEYQLHDWLEAEAKVLHKHGAVR